MRVPRLRWPASPDQNVQKYRLYRWQGARPIAPSMVLETTAAPQVITVRVPMTYRSPGLWAMPIDPGPDAVKSVDVDGLPLSEYRQNGALVSLPDSVGAWQLCEAVLSILGITALDMAGPQSGVTYSGPVPHDTSTTVTAIDIEEEPLLGANAGKVDLRWSQRIETGGGSYYSYEVTAVDGTGQESAPSPVAEVRLSGVSSVTYFVQRSEDGLSWAPLGSTGLRTFRTNGTSIPAPKISDVAYTITRDEANGQATIHLSWLAVPASRTVGSSLFRVRPQTGSVPLGPHSEHVGPIPVTIPHQGVLARIATGATNPTPSGFGGQTLSLVPIGASTLDVTLTDSNIEKRIGLFVQDAIGLFSQPVVLSVSTGDLTNPLDPIHVTAV